MLIGDAKNLNIIKRRGIFIKYIKNYKYIKSKMKNIKSYVILIILLMIYVSICAVSYVSAINNNLSDEVFRLHVIANSDNEYDQKVKYLVRDKVLEYINNQQFDSKEKVVNYLKNNTEKICEIAKQVIKENGQDYDVEIEIGNFSFPTKTYGDITFPAGYYDGMKIKLGEAKGQNWWCVMFPPLCFVDVTSGIVDNNSKKELQENLSTEEYTLISEKSPIIQFKFKLLEIFSNSNIFTAKN